MVFNAVTGVEALPERMEIRGFRSLVDWRRIVESFGFYDTMVYEKQEHDCTDDVMMCFRKPGSLPVGRALQMSLVPDEPVGAAKSIAAALPKLAVSTGMGLVNSLTLLLPKIRQFFFNSLRVMLPNTPGISSALSVQIEKTVDAYLAMLSRFDPLVEAAAPTSGNDDGPSFIPEEIFLLIPVLRIRAKQGGVVEAVVVDLFDKISEAMAGPKPEPKAHPEPVAQARLSEKTFDDEIQKLLVRVPELRDVENVIQNFGVPEKAKDILLAAASPEGAC
jgi:hypothetical protein